MKRENFYRRNPGDALSGMVGMTLEERGVYTTIIDLIYLTWRPLEDSRRYIAGHCGCAVQKVNPIIDRLIASGKLLRFQEDGRWYLSNQRFETERAEVKGEAKTRSGRAGVGEKSREVGEKSAGVSENPALLDVKIVENQDDKPLDRVDRQEKKEVITSSVAPAEPDATASDPWDRDPDFLRFWNNAPPLMRKRSKSKAKVWLEWERTRKRALPSAVLAAFARYRTFDADLPRTGGPGLHIWLKDRTWEQWLPAGGAEAGPEAWSDARWSIALRILAEEGRWAESAGPKPGQPGCRVPSHLLVRPVAVGGAA